MSIEEIHPKTVIESKYAVANQEENCSTPLAQGKLNKRNDVVADSIEHIKELAQKVGILASTHLSKKPVAVIIFMAIPALLLNLTADLKSMINMMMEIVLVIWLLTTLLLIGLLKKSKQDIAEL